jgi:hypothetical protein
MQEAVAKAIWDTWCASPAGKRCEPKGGPFSWDELLRAGESGTMPALAATLLLCRNQAAAAIAAYENERKLNP